MLWQEVKSLVDQKKGVLVLDDTTLDKPYASLMALVTRHWSGKHGRVVQGINLISLVWTDRQCRLPCDFRFYNKSRFSQLRNSYGYHSCNDGNRTSNCRSPSIHSCRE